MYVTDHKANKIVYATVAVLSHEKSIDTMRLVFPKVPHVSCTIWYA